MIVRTNLLFFAMGCLCLWLSPQLASAKSPIVEVKPPDTPPSVGIWDTMSGTFAEMNEVFRQHDEVGRATIKYSIKPEVGEPAIADCLDCNGNPNGLVKAKFEIENVTLTVSWTESIDLPTWPDKANHSNTAQQEWDRFHSKVSAHEGAHIAANRAWATLETIKAFFTDMEDLETICFDPSNNEEFEKAQTDFNNALKESLDAKAEQIANASELADMTDRDDPPGMTFLDESKWDD
ncbi:MAG: DUF922 domain-containing protein [Chthoniobacterales bacterium]|nr:DUF922 domain-containing protein [Chthoniobacterales bacterium]